MVGVVSTTVTEPLAPPTTVAELADRLAGVRDRIDRAGREPRGVAVVGVVKGQTDATVALAPAAGITELAGNYQQELVGQAETLRRSSQTPVRWHFIGALQRNKVAKLAPIVSLWETVDREELGRQIAKHAPGSAVLVQVNTTAEAQKAGCTPAEAPRLVEALRDLDLEVRGLMTIGPAGAPADAAPAFRTLRTLADRLGLPECSMGMSNDLEVAVAEGSTAVRVGTALFGARSRPPHVRD